MDENLKSVGKISLNKTWLLVAALIILTVILLVVSLASKNSSPIISSPKNVETDIAHSSLAISEDVRASSVSGKYEVDINIDTADNDVSGVQLELSYDPEFLSNLDVLPGDFLNNPEVLIKKLDTADGRITYALGIKPNDEAVKGSGVIAVISFSKLKDGDTFIDFLPQTQIASPGINYSVLGKTVSAVIGTLTSTSTKTKTFISPDGITNN